MIDFTNLTVGHKCNYLKKDINFFQGTISRVTLVTIARIVFLFLKLNELSVGINAVQYYINKFFNFRLANTNFRGHLASPVEKHLRYLIS